MLVPSIIRIIKILSFIFLLLCPPLLGVLIRGSPLTPYFAFPPTTQRIETTSFSWLFFFAIALPLVTIIVIFVLRLFRFPNPSKDTSISALFPWWGWAGFALTIIGWGLAWTRFPWFQDFQIHTFTPLWIGYIFVISGLTWKRTGYCLLKKRPGYFLSLFPMSAVFWWLFEYVNRFSQNWYYWGGRDLDATAYFWSATLPFSTVIPAVLSTCELLYSFPRLNDPFHAWRKIQVKKSKLLGWQLIFIATIGLIGIGAWPELWYPFVWISPLFILVGFQVIFEEHNIFEYLKVGDWRPVVIPALAGLMCGVFWEMWNYHSLAHWEYAIPYLHGFKVFEMPILGYSGYFPFGVTCITMVQYFTNRKVTTLM